MDSRSEAPLALVRAQPYTQSDPQLQSEAHDGPRLNTAQSSTHGAHTTHPFSQGDATLNIRSSSQQLLDDDSEDSDSSGELTNSPSAAESSESSASIITRAPPNLLLNPGQMQTYARHMALLRRGTTNLS